MQTSSRSENDSMLFRKYRATITFIFSKNILYLQKVNVLSDDQWPSVLAEYIRHSDEAMLKASERVLASYRDELLPCTSFDEFCDIVGKSV
jgi:hypothetical protein